MDEKPPPPAGERSRSALNFVILIGLVSLFADMTYEGARSITGPFLAKLNASGWVVGIVAGSGELIGYGLRLVSGFWADKTKRYWMITFIGYSMNLIAVPLLALAGQWPLAAALMIAERMGKAIRTPARDAMLSCASNELGAGWTFALHKLLDQAGSMMGPMIVSFILWRKGAYETGFAVLAVPAIMALAVLAAAKRLYPTPADLEIGKKALREEQLSNRYGWYLAGAALLAAGYADFPLIAFHFEKKGMFSNAWIPLLYTLAMGSSACSALFFGKWFDRVGIRSLLLASFMAMFFAPAVFWGGPAWATAGVVLWGIGMGAQESVLRAAIAGMASSGKRGSAYGLFNASYGLAWFFGSAVIGFLYDRSVFFVILFSFGLQLLSLPVLFKSSRLS